MKRELKVVIKKKTDDPLGIVRVSLGTVPTLGYYCVYRGTKGEAIGCLRAALESMLAMAETLGDREPDVEPDDGKRYA